MIKIESLEELEKWNEDPTEELPYVLEWYMDWIFDECLAKKDYDFFKRGYMAMINCTLLCEKGFKLSQAVDRTNANLRYWYNRASKDSSKFKEFVNKITVELVGV